MDPLSINTKVYRFLQSLRHAEPGYAALCTELSARTGFLQSINRTFQDCRRHPFALAAIDEAVAGPYIQQERQQISRGLISHALFRCSQRTRAR
ncbi:hypothetical protein PG985_010433 [Apiospora marii]|uniref:Uncharacterized protein n=1 Tax=Apiospora marii TaxID=335849 RepID=A0ABR1S0I1_9PEZI